MFSIAQITDRTEHNIITTSLYKFYLSQSTRRFIMSVSPMTTLEELFGQVMFSSVVTRHDRRQLRSALLERTLNEDEYAIINRLLYNVRRGWVKIVD
jgi:hypothetical protein